MVSGKVAPIPRPARMAHRKPPPGSAAIPTVATKSEPAQSVSHWRREPPRSASQGTSRPLGSAAMAITASSAPASVSLQPRSWKESGIQDTRP